MKSLRLLPYLPCLVLSLIVAPAFASTVEALDLGGLTSAADEVFVGQAISESVHRDDRERIVTDVRVRVAESLAGERGPGEEVVLRCLGGSIDGVGMRVAGEARLAVGETAVVFARRSDGGWLRAVGMSQGVLPMRPGADGWWVEPGGAGLSLVSRAVSGRLVPARAALERAMPLAELRHAVRAAEARAPRGAH